MTTDELQDLLSNETSFSVKPIETESTVHVQYKDVTPIVPIKRTSARGNPVKISGVQKRYGKDALPTTNFARQHFEDKNSVAVLRDKTAKMHGGIASDGGEPFDSVQDVYGSSDMPTVSVLPTHGVGHDTSVIGNGAIPKTDSLVKSSLHLKDNGVMPSVAHTTGIKIPTERKIYDTTIPATRPVPITQGRSEVHAPVPLRRTLTHGSAMPTSRLERYNASAVLAKPTQHSITSSNYGTNGLSQQGIETKGPIQMPHGSAVQTPLSGYTMNDISTPSSMSVGNKQYPQQATGAMPIPNSMPIHRASATHTTPKPRMSAEEQELNRLKRIEQNYLEDKAMLQREASSVLARSASHDIGHADEEAHSFMADEDDVKRMRSRFKKNVKAELGDKRTF